MRAGDIMAAVTYLTQIFHSVMMFNMMFQTLSRSAASAKRINEVLDEMMENGEVEDLVMQHMGME